MSQNIRTNPQKTVEKNIERSTSETPVNPPGLALPSDRLWQPHEDAYWKSLRDQWGSTLDLSDQAQEDRESNEEMDDVDLKTANGTVFRIVLADEEQHDKYRRQTNSRPRPVSASRQLNAASPPPGDVPYITRPPLAQPKFKGPTLNVSVTTTTRTYSGDVFPPPYTPRPTGTERSFIDGKLADDDNMESRSRWPVAKWLFLFGFLFPLLWLFGSFLLFSGLRKIADTSSIESKVSDKKLDTQSRDTTTSTTIHSTDSITHLIVQEVVWSKRCAWAITIFALCCFTALGVLKAVGM